ncbi:MAG TPA: helix-turn-helix transcriptional regulator [Pirellulales bacterium]|nr:helix-turn-helix transcriptional regulator [Pirellulales bacterium]
MAGREPQLAPDDESRPGVFSLGEWRRIVLELMLSPRMAQVTGLVVQGMSDSEIVSILSKEKKISPYTVRDHLEEIRRRLGVATRGQIPCRVFETFRRLYFPTPQK